MEFFRRASGSPSSLGILPGTFNPPTWAHMALAEAGLSVSDEVLLVLPRTLPHKTYEGVSFADRLRMLEAVASGEPRYSIASTQSGMFIDIARECRRAYGPGATLRFLCGRDAAERIASWDYGKPGEFLAMLREFELLVAARGGSFTIPPEMQHAVHLLPFPEGFDEVSATKVREAIAAGRDWKQWVPAAIAPLVQELYAKRTRLRRPPQGRP